MPASQTVSGRGSCVVSLTVSAEAGRSVVSVAQLCCACRLVRPARLAWPAHRGFCGRCCSPAPAPLTAGALMPGVLGLCVCGARIFSCSLSPAQSGPNRARRRRWTAQQALQARTLKLVFARAAHRSRALHLAQSRQCVHRASPVIHSHSLQLAQLAIGKVLDESQPPVR